MSASREKKQRQASEEPKVSSRAQEEQIKEAKRKRNTIVYSIIGAVVVVLAAILLIWDSGVIQRNQTAATIDGEKVTASQVAYYYYNNSIMQTAQLYEQYGLAFPYYSSYSAKIQYITEDDASELGIEDSYVGKTYHEYFMDYALDMLRQEYALLAAAKEAGYTLSEEGKEIVELDLAGIDDTRESYLSYYGSDFSRNTYLQMVYGDSMSYSKYRECVENSVLANEFYEEYFDTLTDYTDEDLTAYYEAHTAELNSVSYYWQFFDGSVEETKDEDGKTVEPTEEEKKAALEAAKKAAEDAQAKIDGDLDSLKDDEDFTYSDGVPSTTSFAYDWLIDPERKAGDSEIFDGTEGYYLVFYEKTYLDKLNTVNLRHILISAMAEDDPDTKDVDESKEDPTDEAFEAAKKKAQELLDQWKSGDATEESFAALVKDNSADSGSKNNGGLYEQVYNGQMIETFNDWIFDEARQSGDTGLVQNTKSSTQGWHIIYYIGQDEPVWQTSAREGIWIEEVNADIEIVTMDRLDSFFP